MNCGKIEALFSLVRSAVCGELLNEADRERITDERAAILMSLAANHDIAHLVAFAIEQNKLAIEDKRLIKSEIFKAISRYEKLSYELGMLCDVLEKEEIPFIPLKGSVLRKFYPEAWMRTSCDVDLLFDEANAEKAADFLEKNCGYTGRLKTRHDIALFTPNNLHVELHFTLIEEGRVNDATEILEKVWENATPKDGYRYWYELPDEMFYFYHISHMAKHFYEGGCGIRPFIDLWILDNIEGRDKDRRDSLLKEGGLLTFADKMRELADVWLGAKAHNDSTREIEDYILRGGVFGTLENRIIVQQQKKGGRLNYALSRIFMPYDMLKTSYPILVRHRWLTPIMEVLRWCRLLFCGKAKRSMDELKFSSQISGDQAKHTAGFLKNIGL